jgi:hypothetical protein
MTFRYNGGDCLGSFNIQPDTLFFCEDYGPLPGAPPKDSNAISYIVAADLDIDVIWFEGFVQVGKEFTAIAEDRFDANMNVTIYDPGGLTGGTLTAAQRALIVRPQAIQQTIIYHSSCSRNLFLKDRFGAVQLVIFRNVDQGEVTCFVNATLLFGVKVPVEVEGGNVILKSLTVLSNLGIFNLTDQVAGVNLTPLSPTFIAEQKITLDLTVRQKYTALSTIIGCTDEGKRCFGTDYFEFVAGNPLPPIFPTLAPSASPTITPFPTADADTARCDFSADITCKLFNGSPGSCNGLSSPAGSTCLGSNVESLRFVYVGGPCNGDNTMNNFGNRCDDLGIDVSSQQVFIQASKGATVFFSGAVNKGLIVNIPIAAGNNDATIVISNAAAGVRGSDIQSFRFSTRCREQDAITLLSTYGSLQLVGFTNAELGTVNIFEDIQVSVTVTNDSRVLIGVITDAFRVSPLDPASTVPINLIAAPPSGSGSGPQELVPGEVFTAGTENFRLNLSANANTTLNWSFLAAGVGLQSGVRCTAIDTFNLAIGA